MRTFLLLWVWLFAMAGNAQKLLQGIVLDAEKNTPLPKASVFLNNTSIGTTADDAGRFELAIPSGRYELIVSSVGYTTGNQSINTNEWQDFITIKLTLKAPELENIVIEPYLKDGWERWGRFFLESFIGMSAQANDCKILNKNVIRFRFSKKDGRLTAHASEPLLIENKALGYRIRYDLETFRYDSKSQYILYTGYPFFEQLPGKEKKIRNWKKKRQEVYYGSLMHFMRSVYRNNLAQEGFDVRRMKKIHNEEKARVREMYRKQRQGNSTGSVIHIGATASVAGDSSDYYNSVLQQPDYSYLTNNELLPGDSIAFAIDSLTAGLSFPNYLLIQYRAGKLPPEYSRTRPAGEQAMLSHVVLDDADTIAIQSNGMYYNPLHLICSGFWAWSEKLANMLPFDYRPGD